MLATVMRKDKAAASSRRSEVPKPAKAPTRKQSFSAALSKKEKVNVVSKASLAMLNPRLAMGMEASDGFDSPDARGSREWSNALANLKNAHRPVWNDESQSAKWTASPTPELAAFTMEDIVLASPVPSQVLSPPQSAPWTTTQFTVEPQGVEAEEESRPASIRSRKLSSKASNSTLSRLFSRKKSIKGGKLPWSLDTDVPSLPSSHSANELIMPQSAPPTVTTFDLSGGPLQISRSEGWKLDAAAYADSSSLPSSPVRDVQRLDLKTAASRQGSPPRASPSQSAGSKPMYRLSRMQSLPSIRIHDITGAASDETPELPSLDKIRIPASATSPVLPSSPAWENTFGKLLDESGTPTMRPISRCVSSTGRGVPSFSPNKFKDAFSPQLRTTVFGSPTGSKAMRRRSRSLGAANAPPPRLSRFGSPPTIFSPASPSMGVFLPEMADITTPDLSELTAFAAQHTFTSPTSSQVAHHQQQHQQYFQHQQQQQQQQQPQQPQQQQHDTPRVQVQRPHLTRGDSISTAGSSCRSSFEEQDAAVVVEATKLRREDLTQRARAVPIASPSLSGRGAGGRSPLEPSQSAFVVTVMPPTPDLGAECTPRMGETGGGGERFDDAPPTWVEEKEIVIDGPAALPASPSSSHSLNNHSSSPRRNPRSPTSGSPNARIKARRDTVVINNTYAMPQYSDFDALATGRAPKMSFDYFDPSALQQEQAEKADEASMGIGMGMGLRRDRHNSGLSDFTEISCSEMSSSGSSSTTTGGGPFAFAHSLSRSTLAHSPSSSTLGSSDDDNDDSSRRSSMRGKFELLFSPTTSPNQVERVIRRYKFASRTPLDFSLPASQSSSSSSSYSGMGMSRSGSAAAASALGVVRSASAAGSSEYDSEDSDPEDSELGYMADRSPLQLHSVGGAGALESDEAFKADATCAGLYLNSNASSGSTSGSGNGSRLSVYSTTTEMALSPQLELAARGLNFGFELPPTSLPPLSLPALPLPPLGTGLPRSQSLSDDRPHHAQQQHFGGLSAGTSGQEGFTRSASVGDLPTHQQVSPAAALSQHSLGGTSSSHPFARSYSNDQLRRPSLVSLPSHHSAGSASPADDRATSAEDEAHDLHTLALKSGHGFGIIDNAPSFLSHVHCSPDESSAPSTAERRPVLVVPTAGGLSRVRSSKAFSSSSSSSSGSGSGSGSMTAFDQSMQFYQSQSFHHAHQPGGVYSLQQQQHLQEAEPVSPRWRPVSEESERGGYVMAL
ncbi:hypothetical protein OC834_000799 [Tilletia horrida]|nr:hypothetical protein OC834_000799 [Tilletia horrida]